jgi:hypothetical protein
MVFAPQGLQDSARRFNAGNIQSVAGCRLSVVRGNLRFARLGMIANPIERRFRWVRTGDIPELGGIVVTGQDLGSFLEAIRSCLPSSPRTILVVILHGYMYTPARLDSVRRVVSLTSSH